MIDFLVKKFVKNYENTSDQTVRASYGTLGALTGMILNILLSLVKIIVGMLSGSIAVTADGLNNLSDAGGSVVALATVRLAQKPVDKDHPFGHGRVEYIGAMCVGALIVVFGVNLLKDSINGILHPEAPSFSVSSIVLLVLSILVKLWMSFFYKKLGKKTDNPTLIASGEDSLSDVLATIAVVISMILCIAFGWKLDGWFGLLVSLLVLKAGYSVLKDTVNRLLGGAPDVEKGKKIVDMLMAYPEILGVHDFVMHDYGPGRTMASIHAEVSAKSDIVEIHEVIDRAEKEISETLNIPICIHMDPIVTGDEEASLYIKELKAFLGQMNPPLAMHDFRRVPGEKQINLIFDVVLPVSVKENMVPDIRAKIIAKAKELDSRNECVITFDRDYFYE